MTSGHLERLTSILASMDLAGLAEAAGVRPDDDVADRAAMFGKLVSGLVDLADRERLQDLSDVLILDRQATGSGFSGTQVATRAVESFGPYVGEVLDIDALLLGFLKEGANREIRGLPIEAVHPEADHFIVMIAKLLELMVTRCFEASIEEGGTRVPYGGISSCELCGGNGSIVCSDCHGAGISCSRQELELAFARATRLEHAQLAPFRDRDGGIPVLDVARVLRPGSVCYTCDGRGGEDCECRVYVEIPAGFKSGWICRLVNVSGSVLAHARVKTATA